jgi:hypothetical protein
MKNAKLHKSAWDNVQAKTKQKWINNLWGPEQTLNMYLQLESENFRNFKPKWTLLFQEKAKNTKNPQTLNSNFWAFAHYTVVP